MHGKHVYFAREAEFRKRAGSNARRGGGSLSQTVGALHVKLADGMGDSGHVGTASK